MRRRACLAGLGTLAARTLLAAPPARAASGPDPNPLPLWPLWRDRFLAPEGRVIDEGQDGISHSEGQGWGLLLAAAAGDAASFAAIHRWTEAHLAVRRDPLLAWRWHPDDTASARDYNNASDGDLFYAWALLRGARRFDDAAARARAGEVARGIAQICLAADPRDPARPQLLPGAEHFRHGARLTLNPSYVMPRALHDLAAAFDLPALARAAEAGAMLAWEIAETGLPPDWITLDATGWRPARGTRGGFGFEAIRVPLYLAWSGRAGHPAVRRAARLWRTPGAGGTPVRASRAGQVLRRDPAPGYAALAALVAPEKPPHPAATSASTPETPRAYYPETLGLLAALAAHDLGRPAAP